MTKHILILSVQTLFDQVKGIYPKEAKNERGEREKERETTGRRKINLLLIMYLTVKDAMHSIKSETRQ